MSELFSAYVRPRRVVASLLARAALVLPGAVICPVLLRGRFFADASVLVFGGVLVWALSMLGAFLRPGRLALSFAIFGAMLAGTSAAVVAYGRDPDCGCVVLMSFRNTTTGDSQPFRISCY